MKRHDEGIVPYKDGGRTAAQCAPL